jgi:limonene-1,2-epoxide hydrolase
MDMKRARCSRSRRAFTTSTLTALAALGFSRRSFAQAASAGKTVPPEVGKANVAVVDNFCAAFGRKDLSKIVSLLADKCTYRPTHTMPAVVGKEKVAETIKGFLDRDLKLKVLNTVAFGPLVLNERDDTLITKEGKPRTFRVAGGLFFVENGKIVEWTDYFLQ